MTDRPAVVDPSDFIITRKRKKYRFALFKNAANCFELQDWKPLHREGDLTVEVGAGTGLFLVELAKRHPEKSFIAIDVKADRLQKGARVALEEGLNNIFFVRAGAEQLLEIVGEATVNEIWLTFSDPFPKNRDAKHRLTHPRFLEIYRKAHVSKNALLYVKTDNHALFDWSLEQLVATKWQLDELSFDLHNSNLSDEYKIMTTYERRWTDQGLSIFLVTARRSEYRNSQEG